MRISTLVVAGSFALTMVPLNDASAQQRKRGQKEVRSQTPIACTPSGCAPIPAGCRIETGFTQDGMLSGYDAVVCPVR